MSGSSVSGTPRIISKSGARSDWTRIVRFSIGNLHYHFASQRRLLAAEVDRRSGFLVDAVPHHMDGVAVPLLPGLVALSRWLIHAFDALNHELDRPIRTPTQRSR